MEERMDGRKNGKTDCRTGGLWGLNCAILGGSSQRFPCPGEAQTARRSVPGGPPNVVRWEDF